MLCTAGIPVSDLFLLLLDFRQENDPWLLQDFKPQMFFSLGISQRVCAWSSHSASNNKAVIPLVFKSSSVSSGHLMLWADSSVILVGTGAPWLGLGCLRFENGNLQVE